MKTAADNARLVYFKIVETDNFGGDFPGESFLPVPPLSERQAETIAGAINEATGERYHRFWKVVDSLYELSPGFEP